MKKKLQKYLLAFFILGHTVPAAALTPAAAYTGMGLTTLASLLTTYKMSFNWNGKLDKTGLFFGGLYSTVVGGFVCAFFHSTMPKSRLKTAKNDIKIVKTCKLLEHVFEGEKVYLKYVKQLSPSAKIPLMAACKVLGPLKRKASWAQGSLLQAKVDATDDREFCDECDELIDEAAELEKNINECFNLIKQSDEYSKVVLAHEEMETRRGMYSLGIMAMYCMASCYLGIPIIIPSYYGGSHYGGVDYW